MAADSSLPERMMERISKDTLTDLPIRYYIAALSFVALALLPNLLSVLTVLQMIAALYFVMFVISWDFVSGYTGQVSFGHTLFFAIGGYTTTLLNLEYGIDPIVGIVAGVALATIAGALMALPALRIEGHYLALFTLLPPLILLQLFQMYRDTFGGSQGLRSADRLIDAGDFTATAIANYYFSLAVFVFVFGIAWIITRSDTGSIFTAVRESEDAVASVGLNPAKYKIYAFTVSAAIGGLAGALFVHTPVGSASPSQLLEIGVMIEILLAGILGGFGTITGAVVGGFLIYWGLEWLSGVGWTIPVLDVTVGSIHNLLFFTLLLVVLLFLSEGLVPWATQKGRQLRASGTGDEPKAIPDGGRTSVSAVLSRYYESCIELFSAFKRNDR